MLDTSNSVTLENDLTKPATALIADLGLADALMFYCLAVKLMKNGMHCTLYCNYLHELSSLLDTKYSTAIDVISNAPYFNNKKSQEQIQIYQWGSPGSLQFVDSAVHYGSYQCRHLPEQQKSSSFPHLQTALFCIKPTKNSWFLAMRTFVWEQFFIAGEISSAILPNPLWTKSPQQIALCPFHSSSARTIEINVYKCLAQKMSRRGFNPIFFVPKERVEEGKHVFSTFTVTSVPLEDLAEVLHSSAAVFTSSKGIAELTRQLGGSTVALLQNKKQRVLLQGSDLNRHNYVIYPGWSISGMLQRVFPQLWIFGFCSYIFARSLPRAKK